MLGRAGKIAPFLNVVDRGGDLFFLKPIILFTHEPSFTGKV